MVRLPVTGRHCSPIHSVQTGSGTYQAFYSMGTGDYNPRGKTAGALY
jgi:hypothetical protein